MKYCYESIYRLVLITHQSRGPVAGAIAGKSRIWYLGSCSTLRPSHLNQRCNSFAPLIAKTKKTFGISTVSTCDTPILCEPLALSLFLQSLSIVYTTNNHARFMHTRYPSSMYVFHCYLKNNPTDHFIQH